MPEIIELTDENACVARADDLKQQGNEAFKTGELEQAKHLYTQAIKLVKDVKGKDDLHKKATLYKNRAMVHLKLNDHRLAETDCTRALEIEPADAKCLYRRALARKELKDYAESFKDAQNALRLEPKNQALNVLIQELVKLNKKMQEEATSTNSRASKMLQLAFDTEAISEADREKRETAFNNLLVLARESSTGAELLWSSPGILPKLMDLAKTEKNTTIAITCIRIVDEFAKNEKRALKMIEGVGLNKLVRLLNVRAEPTAEYILAARAIVDRLFNALARMDKSKNIIPDKEWAEQNKLLIIKLIMELEDMLTDGAVSARPREAVIDLFTKNLMHMDGGLPRGWSWRFVDDRGLQKLLEVSCQIPEMCVYSVTQETRQHLSICLDRLYKDMVFEMYQNKFDEKCNKFLTELLERQNSATNKVQTCAMLTTVLQGPSKIGFTMVSNEVITNMILEMAESDTFLVQLVAVELLVEVVGKRERAASVVASGLPILKKLFESSNDSIRARALVGLCKCASAGGDDTSRATMATGSTLKLGKTCKKLLDDQSKTLDVRRFAADGLSYVSLDGDVKDWLVQGSVTIRALVELAKKLGAVCVYSVATILVNLTNSYEKPTATPELAQLAQFAKHHVPVEHDKDKEPFVSKRIELLVKEGATSACVAVSNTESKQCLELLARCVGAFCKEKEHRGQVVQEGGAKLLLRIALTAEEKGRKIAAQAIARIGISIDPNIAFPGQRQYEVVRPLLDLLDLEAAYIYNYEALMALTNIAASSDSVRRRIFKEKNAMARIEEYWYEQNETDIRAAATELLMNLMHLEDVRKRHLEPNTDRLKLWALYSVEDDDDRLNRSAAAALFLLTCEDSDACKRLFEELSDWATVLKEMCQRPDPEAQFRCLLIIENLMDVDKDICAKICQTEVIELLIAITKMSDPARSKCSVQSSKCLLVAEKNGFLAPTAREMHERKTGETTVDENAIILSTTKEESDDDEEDS